MRKFTIEKEGGEYIELSAPLKVYYDITTHCNLDCIFCFKGLKDERTVSFEEAKVIIRKVADAKIPDIVFIGGEPMCCQFLFDALEYARSLGLNVGIITNGTLFSEQNARQLKKLVNNSISVSIHAPNDELHDVISKGTNVYTRIVGGLKLLNAAGITPELAFTPVQANIQYLYDTIAGILNQGIRISDVLVNRLIPQGNALLCWNEKVVDYKGQNILFAQMEKLSSEFPDLVFSTGDALPFCMFEEKYRKYIVRCDYAITLGWINEHNKFGKCMVRGSTNFDDLSNQDLRSLWKTSHSFREHRCMQNLPDDCIKCDWLYKCGGGCACSCLGDGNIDAFFNHNNRFEMPKLNEPRDNTVKYSNELLSSVSYDRIYNMNTDFIIRKEREATTSYDEVYLFLPESSGAIIQDVIQPENGTILWINEIEKQVILYLSSSNTLRDIAHKIAYEFPLTFDASIEFTQATIAGLISLGMVKDNERH